MNILIMLKYLNLNKITTKICSEEHFCCCFYYAHNKVNITFIVILQDAQINLNALMQEVSIEML